MKRNDDGPSEDGPRCNRKSKTNRRWGIHSQDGSLYNASTRVLFWIITAANNVPDDNMPSWKHLEFPILGNPMSNSALICRAERCLSSALPAASRARYMALDIWVVHAAETWEQLRFGYLELRRNHPYPCIFLQFDFWEENIPYLCRKPRTPSSSEPMYSSAHQK